MEKGVTKIIFSKIIGVGIFLIFLGILNFLAKYITFESFLAFTGFLNRNALILIGVVVLFLFGELLSYSEFPNYLFGPLLNFLASWLTLRFVFEFLTGINNRFSLTFLETIFLIKREIFITLLSLVLVFGYLPILYKLFKLNRESKPVSREEVVPVPAVIERVIVKEKIIPRSKKKNKKKSKRK